MLLAHCAHCAARVLARERRFDECLAVYRDACQWVPHEFDAWRLSAELELKLGREDAAFETLLEGRAHFRGPQCRAQAIALLVRARAIEPQDADLLLDLARLYGETDQRDAALDLMTALAPRLEESRLRQLRTIEWRLTLSLRSLGLWLRALAAVRGTVSRQAAELEPLPEPGRSIH